MTVAELTARMSSRELSAWMLFFEHEAVAADQARDRAAWEAKG